MNREFIIVIALATSDGKLYFWTTTDSISNAPPESAAVAFANRGKAMRWVPQTGFACLPEDAPPVFAVCQQQNVLTIP